MTKVKLKLLRDLLDEMLDEEKVTFARDMNIAPDQAEDFADRARFYLGKELRLGSSIPEDQEITPRARRGRDSSDVASEFEANCRAVRLRLQRGEKQ